MKAFFLKMLDSKDPSVSSSRFLSIVTVSIVTYTWMWVSIYNRILVDIPSGVVLFVGAVLGRSAAEKFAERPIGRYTGYPRYNPRDDVGE
jgi:hypothetical protein